ncbi:MAG: 3-oxoacid CoA-transferase [Firmicutes bacterium]|nr:3-oxoacid CoA-transferase [Bacillota bacterium]
MKRIDRKEAAALIKDRSLVYVGGFGAASGVDELLLGVSERFEDQGSPAGLTVISAICSGYSNMEEIGHNRLKAEGLMDTIIAGHFMLSGHLSRMISENKVAAYAPPLGAIENMMRAAASGQPGVLEKVGLGTYVDPRVSGCAVNDKARDQVAGSAESVRSEETAASQEHVGLSLIKHVEFDGEDYLFYKALAPDACLIRGSVADTHGNISLIREGVYEYQLEAAMATRNKGGTVIVQVEEVVEGGEIPPKEVRIPGMFVDYVVVASPENHPQLYNSEYRPEVAGLSKVAAGDLKPMPLDVRKVIARRAAMELEDGCVVNLGIGLPAGVGIVANEEGMAPNMTLSLETGPVGGIPLDGPAFGSAINHEALLAASDAFAFYDGGGLDMAFLGAAEVDARGNVNVSMFGTRCAGPGGFINISQNTPKVCYMGTFTAGKQQIEIADGKLNIVQDGDSAKFVNAVQQITFSGDYARSTGQKVLYVTERAVFRLNTFHGDRLFVSPGECALELIEIAPGVDLEKDILAKMEFRPKVAEDLKVMDSWIFE